MTRRAVALIGLLTLLSPAPTWAESAHPWCGTTRDGARSAYWSHREQEDRLGRARAASVSAASEDVGQIAVLLDEGDLALQRNLLDLGGAGLQFAPSGSGYALSRVDRPVVPGGTPLVLADDANVGVALPFAFSYYGKSYASVFVNSDGNLTFDAGESASTARSITRFLEGPPRIAPLFADLDPSIAGSGIATSASADSFSVTWSSVPQFGRADKNTFQVTLWKDGHIDFAYDAAISSSIDQGVVGIAPGAGRNGLAAVDLSAAAGVAASGAIAEGFREQTELDLIATARKFYRTHGDNYQQLVIFSSQTLISPRTFAFQIVVKNQDAGIGDEILDLSALFGSGGRLESVAMMDAHTKYFDDPFIRINGEDTSLSLIGHEVGHRWLARALFRDGSTNSSELLGRDGVHWSFFMDSDASHDEGNDIMDLGAGAFRTVGASLRYGPLDQYLMGIRRPEEVPAFFVVRGPTGTATNPGRAPQSAIEFRGTRKDVAIGDVIAAIGARNPAVGATPPPFRQAFIYVSVGGPADSAAVAKLGRLRDQWEPFFRQSTDGRWSVDARLQ